VWEAERVTVQGFDIYESTTWNRSQLIQVVAGRNRAFSSSACMVREIGWREMRAGWWVWVDM